MSRILTSLFLFYALACEAAEPEDPFENFNRRVQRFNDVADSKVLRPVAKGYDWLLPNPVQKSVGNVFSNLGDLGDSVNSLLQGKLGESVSGLTRVLLNSTIGLGGLFDPASRLGLEDREEDFAQTLSTWGVPPGPYLVIPFMGPSTLRDALASPADILMDPLCCLQLVKHRNTAVAVRLLHQRADLLGVDQAVFGDRYIFFRSAYLQRREYLEKDGEIEDSFEDGF